jgi:hypothetical protein
MKKLTNSLGLKNTALINLFRKEYLFLQKMTVKLSNQFS